MSDPKSSFIRKNLVAIVMIPSIIGLHYGWSLLQKNDTLVKEDERIDLPIFTISKVAWKRISNFNFKKEEDIPSAPKNDK